MFQMSTGRCMQELNYKNFYSNNQKVNNTNGKVTKRQKIKCAEAQANFKSKVNTLSMDINGFPISAPISKVFRSHHFPHDNNKWLYKLKINAVSWTCQKTDVIRQTATMKSGEVSTYRELVLIYAYQENSLAAVLGRGRILCTFSLGTHSKALRKI